MELMAVRALDRLDCKEIKLRPNRKTNTPAAQGWESAPWS